MEKGRDASRGIRLEESDLEELPVRVVFELGRMEFSLGDLRQLAPGAVVPLARPLAESLDIVVNGKRIGHGTLVTIGESVGVRITRLSDDA